VQLQLGRNTQSGVAFQKSRDVLERLVEDHPAESLYRLELSRCHDNLGLILGSKNRWGEAEAAFRQALAVQDQWVGDLPPAFQLERASILVNLAERLYLGGRLEEAKPLFEQARVLVAGLSAEFRAEPESRQQLGECANVLSMSLLKTGQPVEAEAVCRQ